MKRILMLTACSIAFTLLASCNLPGAVKNGPEAWIDAPLTGSVLPINTAVDVVSHSSDPAGISAVELSINDSVVSTDAVPNANKTYLLMKQHWTPTAPGTYQLRVRAQSVGGQWSDYAVVTVTVEGGPGITVASSDTPTTVSTDTVTPASTDTPTPVVTLTPSFTPTSAVPSFTLTENAFCRKGPDISFAEVTAIPLGDSVDIRGVSQDGFWYFVYWKQFKTECWVAAPAGQTSGDLQGVPVLAPPALPTSTPRR